jgi:uncharacterized protein (UPF0332 family)
VTLFDFRAFLDVAEDLSSRNEDEYRRSAVSRAYYAIFGASWRALPTSLQMHMGQGRVHSATWNHYAASSTLASRQIAGIGFRLKRMRDRADYDASVAFAANRVRDALDEAHQALNLLDRHGYQP